MSDFTECLSPESFRIPDVPVRSPWIEHAPFAVWLMDMLRPACLVELGTYDGASYLTFCEAVERTGGATRCYAVAGDDAGEDDEFREEVWRRVSQVNANRYGHFSTLIRQGFDDALAAFPAGSIDLLHIDGQYSHAALRRHLRSWLPKLSRSGVLLLHNANRLDGTYGAPQAFRDLQQTYPTFALLHGHGLGVVAVGPRPPRGLKVLLSAGANQHTAGAVRSAYARLGASLADRLALQHEPQSAAGPHDEAILPPEAAPATLLQAERDRAVAEAASAQATVKAARADAEAARSALQYARSDAAARAAELRSADVQRKRDREQLSILAAQRDQLLASTSWRITAPLRWLMQARPRRIARVAGRLVKRGPAGALRRMQRVLGRFGVPVGQAQPGAPSRSAVQPAGSATNFDYQPLVSIIVPVFNVSPDLLRRAVASVRAQTYPNWEICICDDGSSAPGTIDLLQTLGRTEPKLRIVSLQVNSGISKASNEALALAQGTFVAFLDNDDELAPHALEACVAEVNRDRTIDVLYSDEDKLAQNGQSVEPFLKPDWSPSLLREVMYVGHLLVARRSLVSQIGGFDPAYDGVQDFELMLRLSEQTRRIHHVRDILYHWRSIPGSVADRSDAKPMLGEKQAAAVNAHLSRLGLAAQAEQHPTLPHRAVLRPAPRSEHPRISIIIPTRDAPAFISRCLDSIFARTGYPDFEVVVVDNETTDPLALAALDRYPVVRVPFPGHFNFSRANNVGVAAASGDILVLLNNDTEVVCSDWLEQMLFLLDDPDVAAVGPMLLYPDGTVQHAGVALGIRGTADHVLRGLLADEDGYFGSLACTREVSAVTFACVMLRRSDYDRVGGLQELYGTHYQDVDFCLRLREQGRRILYTPRTHLIHHESATRGSTYDMLDRALLLDAWGATIAAGDPYSRWEPAARAA